LTRISQEGARAEIDAVLSGTEACLHNTIDGHSQSVPVTAHYPFGSTGNERVLWFDLVGQIITGRPIGDPDESSNLGD